MCLDPPEVVILDACAILWTVCWPGQPAKVSYVVSAAVATILRYADTATQVLHVVFDRYHQLSTKSCCRAGRQKGFSRLYMLSKSIPIPKQTLVLTVTANNKLQVIKMIVDRLSIMEPLKEKKVITTGPDLQPVCMGVGPLQTAVHHEEADVLVAYHLLQEARN